MRVALISLEPWDQVWRRNQHFAAQLVNQGIVEKLLFVEPPLLSRQPGTWSRDAPGITVLRPKLRIPKRAGGIAFAGAMLRSGWLRDIDALWINDATLGVACLRPGIPALYDVTDDWRTAGVDGRERRRLVHAEDVLSGRATTVVCSDVLRRRWRERYGVEASVVQNGVDVKAVDRAAPRQVQGAAPRVAYVGTVHPERLDLELLGRLAESPRIGSVHLVGPTALGPAELARLAGLTKVVMHGPVASAEVPSWLKAMDVLLCPHVISPFTLSLDAIKAHEYLASGRPVVATPTSGFENVQAPGVTVVPARTFVAAVEQAVATGGDFGARGAVDWSTRAAAFGALLKQLTSQR